VIGGVIIAVMVLLAVGAPLLAPFDPVRLSLSDRLLAPGATHYFGTDELGRDIFSRVMFGARISLSIGLLVISVAGITGALIGATSGYFGGRTDNVIMRFMDVILSFPSLILALALAAALGPSLVNAILATAFVMTPQISPGSCAARPWSCARCPMWPPAGSPGPDTASSSAATFCPIV
jgi:ABC-type dipeptide/oligopeptide/nickel transport systems, permease components